jgi:hypothetical protein
VRASLSSPCKRSASEWNLGRLFSTATLSMLLILLFLSLQASSIPAARAGQTPSLTFTTLAPVVRGYQGLGFYFAYNITDNLHQPERLTNLTVSLDYGTYQACTRADLGPQICNCIITLGSLGNNIGNCWIPIPGSEPLGNQTIHATINFQYFDNKTNGWVTPSDSPQQTTETLTILPSPESTALNQTILSTILPIAGILAIPGILLAALSIRRARSSLRKGNSQANSSPNTSRTLAPFIATVSIIVALLILDSVIPFSQVYPTPLVDANVIGFLALLGTSGVLFARGNYPGATLLADLFLGFSATAASTLHAQTIELANTCYGRIVGAGFPLPWAPFTFPSTYYPEGPGCIFYTLDGPRVYGIQSTFSLAPLAFFLDALFYFALGLCLIETYRIVVHRQTCRQLPRERSGPRPA